MNCVNCNRTTSAFTCKKGSDGYICKDCLTKIPKVLHKNLSKYSLKSLNEIMEYEDNLKSVGFNETSSFGKLHLDEIHGLFTIANKCDENGHIIKGEGIFYCLDIDKLGIYCTNVKASNHNIICDIEFSCKFSEPDMEFKTTLIKGIKCNYKRINNSQVEWEEPGQVSMFRNMLNQMHINEYHKKLRDYQKTEDYNLAIAKSIFMLSDNYDISELSSKYEFIKIIYKGSKDCEEQLKFYYDLLFKKIEGE